MAVEDAVSRWAGLTPLPAPATVTRKGESSGRACVAATSVCTPSPERDRRISDLLMMVDCDDMAPATLPPPQGRHADLVAPMQGLLREAGAASEASASKRHCWECVRRRLECDAARPVCTKCRKAGIVCPGYEDKKPLKWLAPGRITSRARKPKNKEPPATESHESVAVVRRKTASPIDQQRAAMEIFGPGGQIPLVHFQDDVTRIVQATSYCQLPPRPPIYPVYAPGSLRAPWS